MPFPTIDTPKIPYYTALEGVYKGINDANVQTAQEQSNLSDLFKNMQSATEMPYWDQRQQQDVDYKQAQIGDLAAKQAGLGYYNREKPVDPKKQAGSLLDYQSVAYPMLSAIVSQAGQGPMTPEKQGQLDQLLEGMAAEFESRNDASTASLLRSKNMPLLQAFVDRSNVAKNRAGIDQAGIGAQARRDVATTNLEGTKYKADTSLTAARMKANAAMNKASTTGSRQSYENAATALRNAAESTKDTIERDVLIKRAEAFDKLVQDKARAATQERAESQRQAWNMVMGGKNKKQETPKTPDKLTTQQKRDQL